MDYHSFFKLIISFAIFFTLIDSIVLYNWQKFVKSNKWNSKLYKIPWLFFSIIIPFYLYNSLNRLENNNFDNNQYYVIFNSIIAIWFTPKIIILIYLFIKFLFKRISNFFKPKHIINKIDKTITLEDIDSSKRKLILNTTKLGFAIIPFAIVGSGIKSSFELRVRKVEIPLYNLPKALDGITLVQISDIHAGSYASHHQFQEVNESIKNLKPDILFVTGDFVNYNPNEIKVLKGELERLKADVAVIGCLGNHDHYMNAKNHSNLNEYFKKHTPIQMLNNELKILDIHGTKLNIAGVDNSGMNMHFADFNKALDNTLNDVSTILLCHDPSNWDKSIVNKRNVDLTLSGHTHGGQVQLKLLGLEFNPGALAYKQFDGLYKKKDQYLYVNTGLGTVGPPIRIGVPPEITQITLRKLDSSC